MASVQEPEVQFAQKLASNEKSTRTKAIKKLRKYISVRSQRAAGGFTSDELLKLWKGLFYCLWMQDKPLLQEELSKQISGLIHCFHDPEGQFLYLESFLLTFKREWTGIDRLRMDKFFQLVRFMFRQTFELLKRTDWESSVVSRFLQLVVAQLLQTGSEAPSGLQFHVLDLYMTELAALGSAELTADQNLTFIEPFCKTAARTKDRTLFRAICSSIFSTIIDQAPFAIEDLMKEVRGSEDLDSESSEEDEDQIEAKTSRPLSMKSTGKQVNGSKSNDEEEDDEDDEFLHLEDSDTESQGDADIGPVLQFDYGALADKLLALSGRSSTPSHNRQRLYKIIKVLRDLSEGIFPQDEYPEEVSTDEDDDMFGSRTRVKRGSDRIEDEEGTPAQKKSKGKKKEAPTLHKQTKDSGIDEQAGLNSNDEKKKKKKRKKKKKVVKGESAAGEENAEKVEQAQNEAQSPNTVKETEGSSPAAEAQSSISSVKVTAAATAEGQSETLLLSEVKKQPSVTVTEEASTTDSQDQSESVSETTEPLTEVSPEADAPVSGKKKKKKKKSLKAESQADGDEKTENTEPEIGSVNNEASEMTITAPDTDTATPAKKKGKKKILKADVQVKNKRKKSQKEAETTVEEEPAAVETPQGVDAEKLLFEITMTTPSKKKKTPKAACQIPETHVAAELPLDETEAVSSSKKPTKKRRKIPVVFEFEADEQEAASINGLAGEETSAKKTKLGNDVEEPPTPLSSKKSQKKVKAASQSDFITFQSHTVAPTPLFCKTKGGCSTPLSSKKVKKSQTPKSESKKVTFGLKNNKTAEFRKTDRSLLVSPDGSSRVAFDPKQKPKFGVLKSPPTPLSASIKKANRKTSLNTQKSTPKRRPSAADFF